VDTVPPGSIVFVVPGPIDAVDLDALGDAAGALIRASPSRASLICDVGALDELDETALDALARIQLAARRTGQSIRLRNASRPLVDLIALVGFGEVLPLVSQSGGDLERQAEQREQLGTDEEVDRGDPVA